MSNTIKTSGLFILLMISLLISLPALAQKQRINHVVLCWLKEPGNTVHRQQIIHQSKQFSQIPGVLEIRTGEVIPSDRKIVDDSFDVAIYLTFADSEKMNAYITHPEHKKAVKEVIKPLVKKIVVYDFLEKEGD